MEHEPGSYTIQGPDWWEKYGQVMLFVDDDKLIWMMMMMIDVENYQWWMMDDPILYLLDAHLPAPLPNLVFSSKSNLNITATTVFWPEAWALSLVRASRLQNPLSMVSKNLTLGTWLACPENKNGSPCENTNNTRTSNTRVVFSRINQESKSVRSASHPISLTNFSTDLGKAEKKQQLLEVILISTYPTSNGWTVTKNNSKRLGRNDPYAYDWD